MALSEAVWLKGVRVEDITHFRSSAARDSGVAGKMDRINGIHGF